MTAEEKVACRTPAEGRDGFTNIPKWKFDRLRTAILDILGEGGIAFSELPAAVKLRLSDDELSRLGSVGWHVTTVKLELEVRGEIRRKPGPGKQVLILG